MSDNAWPRCEFCANPAVCLGAELVKEVYRCGQCCWQHEGNEAIEAHRAAEGMAKAPSRHPNPGGVAL